jgi:hypothetical protein
MKEGHRRQDELCRYVEGRLSEGAASSIERHLDFCDECASFADSYARFLAAVEAAPVADPGLDDAAARLDAKMAPYLRSVLATEAPATQILRRCFGIADVLRIATQKLRELARLHPEWRLVETSVPLEPARAWAGVDRSVPDIPADHVVVSDLHGVETTTPVRLAYVPSWPSERVDLLLEFELEFQGWEAAVSYVLDTEPAAQGPTALLLYEGPVDEEGLIEIQKRWEGPIPHVFDTHQLRICLVSDKSMPSRSSA